MTKKFLNMLSISTKIARNSILQITGKMISLFLGLVAIAIMTRYLGQEGFGYYTTVIAFLSFFGILVDFGLTLTTIQMISRQNADIDRTMSNMMTLRVISSAIFMAIAPIVVMFFNYNQTIEMGVLICALSFFCTTLIQILTGVFQKELKMFEVTVAELAGRVILVALTAAAAYYGKSIEYIFWAISIGSLINLLLVCFYSKRYVKLSLAFDFEIWKSILKRTWPIALSISFNLIYLKMDTIILSLVRSQSEVGLYGATYRVVDILTMLPAVYMGIVLPHLTVYFNEDKRKELFELLQKAFNALMIFCVPIVLGTFLVARKLMVFVAGAAFAESGEILKVLILASGAIFATSLFGYAVVAVHKQRQMMWGYLTTAVLTLAGYLVLIPIYGYWAAAWMTVFSEVLIMIWTAIVVYQTIKFVPKFNLVWKCVISSLIMLVFLKLFTDFHILILLLIAGVVYFGMLYLLGGLKKGFAKGLVKGE